MAGGGVRFKKAGIDIPKPMILAKDKTLFEWALISLTNFFDNKFIFVAQSSHHLCDFIREKCSVFGIEKVKIKEIAYLTDGQAATVMAAEELITDLDEDIMIYNIDTYVETDELRPEGIRGEGWVPVFEVKGDHWSFVKFDSDSRIKEITEKNRISPYGSIGLYYFKSFSLFKSAYNEYYEEVNSSEKYIAPIYNILLRQNKKVYASVLNKNRIHVLGTPEEVKIFQEDAR
jgi:NDP-sugar pyrophosphorylase family protein